MGKSSSDKLYAREKLLAAAHSVIGERITDRMPQAHDDAQAEYADEQLVIAAREFAVATDDEKPIGGKSLDELLQGVRGGHNMERPRGDGAPADEGADEGPTGQPRGEQSGSGSLPDHEAHDTADHRAGAGRVADNGTSRSPDNLPAAASHLKAALACNALVLVTSGDHENKRGQLMEIHETGFGLCHGVVQFVDGDVRVRVEPISTDVTFRP